MLEAGVRYINETFDSSHVTPEQLDILLAEGWRHFGSYFFRYSLGIYEFDIRLVIPLRIDLKQFSLSKSQRRVLRQNTDLSVDIEPIQITDQSAELFDRHKQRFKWGVPNSIYEFLSEEPASVPCEGKQIMVSDGDRLVAVSYFDVGLNSISAVYGMFDPEFSDRSLGIFTMLKEIEFAKAREMKFYYQGYAYEGESFYDYKKKFRGTEVFDWRGNWNPLDARGVLNTDRTDETDTNGSDYSSDPSESV